MGSFEPNGRCIYGSPNGKQCYAMKYHGGPHVNPPEYLDRPLGLEPTVPDISIIVRMGGETLVYQGTMKEWRIDRNWREDRIEFVLPVNALKPVAR